MLKRLLIAALIGGAGLTAFWYLTNRTPAADQTSLTLAPDADISGFARAYQPIDFVFPKDHGPHFDYQTEWWYYTGNVDGADGHHYGYQLTIFRRGLTPGAPPAGVGLATNQIYFAHFAVTDGAGNSHTAVERFSRGAGELAGAQGDPYRVWIEDWSATGLNADGSQVRLTAKDGPMALDLTLTATKSIVKEGVDGLSQKSPDSGNASYYVSYTRMDTLGRLTINGQTADVHGSSWFDHEWSTSALGQSVIGWNWFSLQLSDGRDLMFYQFRMADGTTGPLSAGTLVEADGSTGYLKADDAQVTADQTWHSPATAADYPSHWRIVIPSAGIDLTLEPYVADQEMRLTSVYWEGAVHFSGVSRGVPVAGVGYVEMTGYKGLLRGTF
jgi:predicted secreted hydrolase